MVAMLPVGYDVGEGVAYIFVWVKPMVVVSFAILVRCLYILNLSCSYTTSLIGIIVKLDPLVHPC